MGRFVALQKGYTPAQLFAVEVSASTVYEMEKNVQNVLASLPVGALIVQIEVDGTGTGGRFLATISYVTTGGEGLDPASTALIFYIADNTDTNAMMAQRSAAEQRVPPGYVILETLTDGASQGHKLMGCFVTVDPDSGPVGIDIFYQYIQVDGTGPVAYPGPPAFNAYPQRKILNFTNVSVSDSSDSTDVTFTLTPGFYQFVAENGVAVPQRGVINFWSPDSALDLVQTDSPLNPGTNVSLYYQSVSGIDLAANQVALQNSRLRFVNLAAQITNASFFTDVYLFNQGVLNELGAQVTPRPRFQILGSSGITVVATDVAAAPARTVFTVTASGLVSNVEGVPVAGAPVAGPFNRPTLRFNNAVVTENIPQNRVEVTLFYQEAQLNGSPLTQRAVLNVTGLPSGDATPSLRDNAGTTQLDLFYQRWQINGIDVTPSRLRSNVIATTTPAGASLSTAIGSTDLTLFYQQLLSATSPGGPATALTSRRQLKVELVAASGASAIYDDPVGNQTVLTIYSGNTSSNYQTVQENGVDQPQESKLNFVADTFPAGSGVVDDPGNLRTNVNLFYQRIEAATTLGGPFSSLNSRQRLRIELVNAVGTNAIYDDGVNNSSVLTIYNQGSSAPRYQTIQNNGTPVVQRDALNFVTVFTPSGANFSDEVVPSRTNFTIAYQTIQSAVNGGAYSALVSRQQLRVNIVSNADGNSVIADNPTTTTDLTIYSNRFYVAAQQNGGALLPQQRILNFIAVTTPANSTLADDAGNSRTNASLFYQNVRTGNSAGGVGSNLTSRGSVKFEFLPGYGTNNAADDAANNQTVIQVYQGLTAAPFYQTIQGNGAPVTQRGTFNFISTVNGATPTVADDAGNSRTNVNLFYQSIDQTVNSGVFSPLQSRPKLQVNVYNAAAGFSSIADNPGPGATLLTIYSNNFYTAVQVNGTLQNARRQLNLIAGTNVTLGVVDDAGGDRTSVTINSSGGGGAGGSAQVYEVAATSAGLTIWSGGAGSIGNMYVAAVIPAAGFTATQMSSIVNQTGAADVRMAIYDSGGNLLGQTGAVSTGTTGIKTAALTPSVALVGNQIYYLAVWSNSNGAQFYSRSGAFTGAGPALSVLLANVALSPGLPASIALTNKVTNFAWALAAA